MEERFTESTKTGDIVIEFPLASQIFKEHKIDFCCGGNRPIGEALDQKQLNKQEVLEQINQLYVSTTNKNTQVDWKEKSYSELIDHVLETHHAYLNQVLPELSGYVTKVNRVHGANHPELSRVYTLFHHLKAELEHHLPQEEEAIFPKIKQYEQVQSRDDLTEVVTAIDTLESEHTSSGNLLKELREATEDYKIPEGACNTYRLTYLKLEELESDLFQHIHLENNILFPQLVKENAS